MQLYGPTKTHADAEELIDIAEEAGLAAREALRRLPHARVDTSPAAPAPLAVGDRLRVREQLRRLVGMVYADAMRGGRRGASGLLEIVVRGSLADDGSIRVRVEAGAAWRELRLPVACTAALDAPALAQIERYGFQRLASSTEAVATA
ncbi:MAG TPA: hypothetical protein VFN74_18345 [Chloroflexota bacterium]|nr:hypothetical protein [Chloroflexota bacterium]